MNIELEAQLDELAKICCEAIKAGGELNDKRVRALIESIVRCGYEHNERKPVSFEIEKRIKANCREPSMHRGAEIKSLSARIQSLYDDVVRWQSQQPDGPSTPPKAANISSATRA
jgi:hypothetical protein